MTSITLVCDNNHAAISDALDFESNSIYSKIMCGNETSGGSRESTFENSLDRLIKYVDPKKEDIDYFVEYNNQYTTPRCCLPKGHSGPCESRLLKYYTSEFANKIKDCHMAPPGSGTNTTVNKNRGPRSHAIQILKVLCQLLVDEYPFLKDLPKEKRLAANLPIENAATEYLISTAIFDMASLFTLQKGITYKKKFDKDVLNVYQEHAERLSVQYAEKNIYIVNNGYLCDPGTGDIIQKEWYTKPFKDTDWQMQFGHVDAIQDNKYMTRGGNIIPITRGTNLFQTNSPLKNIKDRAKKIYEWTNQ